MYLSILKWIFFKSKIKTEIIKINVFINVKLYWQLSHVSISVECWVQTHCMHSEHLLRDFLSADLGQKWHRPLLGLSAIVACWAWLHSKLSEAAAVLIASKQCCQSVCTLLVIWSLTSCSPNSTRKRRLRCLGRLSFQVGLLLSYTIRLAMPPTSSMFMDSTIGQLLVFRLQV